MNSPDEDQPRDPAEVAQRRDEALRRALNTPPQHRHGKVKESTEGQPEGARRNPGAAQPERKLPNKSG
jgi:hypothetical protein